MPRGKVKWETGAQWITPALVKEARELLGWPQRVLAEKAGMSLPTLQKFECNRGTLLEHVRLQVVFAFSRAHVHFFRDPEDPTVFDVRRIGYNRSTGETVAGIRQIG